MKKLELINTSFRYLEQSFKEWLDVMGYAPGSVYYMPLHVRELLHHLEGKGLKNIKELDNKYVQGYYKKLKERSNQRRAGGISNNHLNKHIQALRKFTDYLRQVGRLEIPALSLRNEATDPKTVAVLTEEEIQLLFKASYRKPARNPNCMNEQEMEALQARDRAMLAIYYGCGLRRNEGVCLNAGDINFDRAMVHVRKGKNYRERFVPVSKTSLKYLQDYVYDHRGVLLQSNKSESFFVSQRDGKVQVNPVTGIKVQGVKRKALYHIFEPQELHGIYNSYQDLTLKGKRNKVMLSLLVYQGMKTEELIKLEVQDVKLREGKIEIHGGRKSERRILQLESHQVLEFYEYVNNTRKEILAQSGQTTDRLFVSIEGGDSLDSCMHRLMFWVKRKNKLVVNAKQLRASVIVKWLKQYNLRQVQYLAGHRYISSTESYQQSEMQGLTEEVNKFHPLG